MSHVHLIAVPYDSGIRGWRMGAGPDRLLESGLADALRAAGHNVAAEHVEFDAGPGAPEIAATFALAGQLAARVRAARAEGALPIVLAGNCASAIGTLAGIDGPAPAIVWLDAHGDLNTPETTHSGMLDGMALSIATGRCWASMAARVPGFRPVSAENVCLVGTRDLDDAEADYLNVAAIPVLSADRIPDHLPGILDALRSRTGPVYLHIDLDVLDPSEGRANPFAADGGLLLRDVLRVIEITRSRTEIAAIALTAYDPGFDPDGRIADTAREIAAEVLK